jgi:hypothetical protein
MAGSVIDCPFVSFLRKQESNSFCSDHIWIPVFTGMTEPNIGSV